MSEKHIIPFLWLRGEDERVIRTEMKKISECGIGEICVEARPHDDFCKDGWWKDLGIVIDEAKKLNMRIWILDDKHFPTGYANGLIEVKYPERKKVYINCTVAEVFGSRKKLTLEINSMMKPTIGFWEIGKSVDEEERKNNQLISVVALKHGDGKEICETFIDLTEYYDGKNVNFTLPEGQWRVHVVYKTRTDGGADNYINPIDKLSAYTQIEGVYEPHFEKFGSEFGKTIAGFFSDEPQFGNIKDVCFDTKLGKKKMPLPWSDELEEILLKKYGVFYYRFLPYLFIENESGTASVQFRFDYMDSITKLYKENFSNMIGKWCEEHHVEYIGHVVEDNGVHSRLGMGPGHYFRAMEGQHMAGIDCIGGQVVYGAPNCNREGMTETDGEFFHYVLGKLGSSCGNLDPKKKGRTMCELFGAYGWSLGVRDMKYILDHFLVKGVNYLVPHAFSMAEYPDRDCPPHFYARGNNPEFPYFAELMKYAEKMCGLLSEGKPVTSVAVLYDAEADWIGDHMPMQKVCRHLNENQINFEIVCLDMLDSFEKYQVEIKNEVLIINGIEFKALIVPKSKYIDSKFIEFIKKAEEFPIIFVDEFPEFKIQNEYKGEKTRYFSNCKEINLDEVANWLKNKSIYDIRINKEFEKLSFYHYKKEKHIFVFLNESAEEIFEGIVEIPLEKELIFLDSFNDKYEELKCVKEDGNTKLNLILLPGEICIITEKDAFLSSGLKETLFRQKNVNPKEKIDISKDWIVCKAKVIEYPKFQEKVHMNVLEPISDLAPNFSGIIKYEKTVMIESTQENVYFEAENIFEVMKVWVNELEVGITIRNPYRIRIDKYLKTGENSIIVEVATTPARDLTNYPKPNFDFFHEVLEPTGMFGNIEIVFY